MIFQLKRRCQICRKKDYKGLLEKERGESSELTDLWYHLNCMYGAIRYPENYKSRIVDMALNLHTKRKDRLKRDQEWWKHVRKVQVEVFRAKGGGGGMTNEIVEE